VSINVNHSDCEYAAAVPSVAGERRKRGSIRRRGKSFQVLVYAGLDPLTGRRMYLSGSSTSEAEAKRILNRLRAQVEAQLNPRTTATFAMAFDAWIRTHEVEENTRSEPLPPLGQASKVPIARAVASTSAGARWAMSCRNVIRFTQARGSESGRGIGAATP
jgi:hypothetical protein